MARLDISKTRVLITGASSGIGAALARTLAAHGAQLILAARRQHILQAMADDFVQQGWQRPVIIPADLSVAGQAQAVAQQAMAQVDGIDILVNNAGVGLVGAQHVVGDAELARKLFETNYWSPLALVNALAPGMQQRGQGLIINVTSTLQVVPLPLMSYYSASKAAFNRATQAMRMELKPSGIAVMEVVPGGTDTPTRHQDQHLPLNKAASLPQMPLVTPEETAQAIVRGIQREAQRVVYPRSSLVPLSFPAIGSLIARISSRYIDAGSEKVMGL